MTQKFRDLAWGAAGLMLVVFLGVLSQAVIQVQEEARGLSGQAGVVIRSAAQATGKAHRSLDTLATSAEHSAKYYGLLAHQLPDRMVQVKAVLNNANTAVRSADALLQDTRKQVNATGASANTLTANADKALQVLAGDADAVLTHANDSLHVLDRSLGDLGGSAKQLEHLLAMKETRQIPVNVAGVTAKADEAMGYARDRLKPTARSFWKHTLPAALTKVGAALVAAIASN